MESRSEKLASARKKLKDHQEKKTCFRDMPINSCVQENLVLNEQSYSSEETRKIYDNVAQNYRQNHELDNEICNAHEINLSKNSIKTQDTSCVVKEAMFNDDIQRINSEILSLNEEKNKLLEQLEFTHNVILSKDSEILSYSMKVKNLEDQNNALNTRIQQLSGGSEVLSPEIQHINKEADLSNSNKMSALEEQLQLLHKERDQITVHYEHYVAEINEQLKSTLTRNDQLSKEIEKLISRETSLVEQISQMEIRLQTIQNNKSNIKSEDDSELILLKHENESLKETLTKLQNEHEETIKNMKITEVELQSIKEKYDAQNMENISISKLSDDIASDKIAAQRATEQNLKLKDDLQELEKAFVKMSQDKLELTEKLSAEKYLNRELTIKLSEKEEKLKTTHVALIAKDNEMIRLLSNYSDLEKRFNLISKEDSLEATPHAHTADDSVQNVNSQISHQHCVKSHDSDETQPISSETPEDMIMPKEDAMLKLQERFFKIMEDVANLSDEKHRLEHIVTQLQNETDTICEYVALYQQQRSLLKKRDEARSAQIKSFQNECSLLRNQLNNLSEIIVKLTEDDELSAYFKSDSRRNEISSTLELLKNLRDNAIINSDTNCATLNNFYPCSCCSGKLIDV